MNRVIITFLAYLLLFTCCSPRQNGQESDSANSYDFPEVKEKGVLTAVTLYSSTSYFQYKMQPMGYEYELIKDFAKSQGLQLEIKIAQSTSEMVEMLKKEEADVIAYPIFVSNLNKRKLLFCGHERQTNQVIVQRANKGDTILTDVTQLLGKKVMVLPETKYAERLSFVNIKL